MKKLRGACVLKHGMAHTKIYRAWRGMVDRCHLKTSTAYYKYGARGIRVCDRWRKFENFYADMGDRPSPDHSLERIDNNGPYSPENCRWATRVEQGKNKRNNIVFTHNGDTLVLKEWCRKLNLNYGVVHSRVRRGKSPKEALGL